LNEYLRKDIPGEDRLTGLFLVNTHGYIFSHNNVGFLLKNIREIWPGDMGFLFNRDRLYQENHYFLKTRAIPNTDLILGIMKKKKGLFFSQLTKIQKSSYGYLLIIAAVCLLVGGFVAFLSSKKIVKPLNRLSERAEAAEKGDYNTVLELNTGDELEHLSDVMHHFIKKTKENINKLDDELNLAKHVQENLLPKKIKNFKEVEIVFEMKIPKRVGGDYLDIIPLNNSKLAIIMADASGKSFYGAFHIMMVRALIHTQIKQLDKSNPSPKKILMEMARSVEYNKIHHGNHGADMVAILFGILDIEKMEFSFCAAGHPPVFHHSNSQNEIMLMEEKGMPLGVGPLDKHVYTTKKFPVQKNDLLFFCSDGLLEQHNSDEEVFGEERTKQLLKKYSGLPISQLKELIFQEVFSFKGENVEQTDDISLILLRI
jgi:serine phosphatase RsbU (regulator of sigma subunit)